MIEIATQLLDLVQANDPVVNVTLVALAGFGATGMSALVALAVAKRKK